MYMKYSDIDFNNTGKPLKYYTKTLEKDAFHVDGFGISNVALESKLQRSVMTNYRTPQTLGTLPLPTTAGRSVQNPLIPPEVLRTNKSCQPSSDNFYNRSFRIFETQPDIGKHVQASIDYRQGTSSRVENKEPAKNQSRK